MRNMLDVAEPARNDARYTQIKVNVMPEIAEAFRTACKTAETTLVSVLSECMIEYAGAKRPLSPQVSLDTRKKRRKEANGLLMRLERVVAAEIAALENTPENLRGSERCDEAEEIVSALESAAEALREAYA
jgi:hypothetical protein